MIVVTGATGAIGRHLVAALTAAGVPFRAMVRDPARARGLECALVRGDFDDPATLPAAFAGADQLFLNAGAAGPVDGPQPMVRQQVTAIDAARAAGIGHVVKVSVWRAGVGSPLAEGAHGEIERHLAGSGPTATLLRPGGFMQNFVTGVAGFTPAGELIDPYAGARVSYIDCADIAACAAAVLTGGPGRGAAHVLTGPEALTATDIAARLSAALGRTVPTIAPSSDELRAGLVARGLPAAFAADVATLSREVAAGALASTTTAVEDLTGRPARTFDRFIADELDALRRAVPVPVSAS
jgi:NAD(P)H dehydrogenase (quinone)